MPVLNSEKSGYFPDKITYEQLLYFYLTSRLLGNTQNCQFLEKKPICFNHVISYIVIHPNIKFLQQNKTLKFLNNKERYSEVANSGSPPIPGHINAFYVISFKGNQK